MRVTVDAHLCSGHGRCYVLSPTLFTSDDDGYCAERGTSWTVPAGSEDSARLAVDSCPEGAISLQRES
jgi:ferredoxin